MFYAKLEYEYFLNFFFRTCFIKYYYVSFFKTRRIVDCMKQNTVVLLTGTNYLTLDSSTGKFNNSYHWQGSLIDKAVLHNRFMHNLHCL